MPIRPTTRWLSLLAVALTALALGACGDDDDDSGSAGGAGDTAAETATEGAGGAEGGGKDAAEAAKDLPSGVKGDTLELAAVEDVTVPSVGFSEKRATVDAGRLTLTMRNPEGTQFPHAIAITGNGVDKSGKTVKAGGTSTVTANLKPGKYVFYCPVATHRRDGMKGTLTVR